MTGQASSRGIDAVARSGWLIVRVTLPGVPLETVHVDLSEDALIIWGEDRPGRCEAFAHPVALPNGAWPDRARATLSGGVLDVRVPVRPHGYQASRSKQKRVGQESKGKGQRYMGRAFDL